MEQMLTTVALIAGGIFAVWILFADPGGEDSKGEMNMALLGALLMIPLIILLLIGIVLFLPIVLGIALVVLLAYAVFQLLLWMLTRERKEKSEKVGMRKTVSEAFERVKRASRSVMDSRPLRAVSERTVSATRRTRKAIADVTTSMKDRTKTSVRRFLEEAPKRFRETVERVRSSAPSRKNVSKRFREVVTKSKERTLRVRESITHRISDRSDRVRRADEGTSREKRDGRSVRTAERRDDRSNRSASRSKSTGSGESTRNDRSKGFTGRTMGTSMRERLHRWRSALKRRPLRGAIVDERGHDRHNAKASPPSKRNKLPSSERTPSKDPLQNMRKIGWNTRKHLGEMYHH